MKKNSIFAISAITLGFLLLGAVTVYITIDYFMNRVVPEKMNLETEFHFVLEEEFRQSEYAASESAVPEPAAQTVTDVDTQAAEVSKAAVQEPEITPKPGASTSGLLPADDALIIETESIVPDHRLIWIGDSRTVAIGKQVKDDCVFLGEEGIGYDWLMETGSKELQDAMKRYPDVPVVFGFGVNDSENLDLYLSFYKSLQEKYPDTPFYYLSVNPIDPARCSVISNEEIATFNSKLKEEFQDHYLNTFTWLMVSEAVTVDGIHFDEATNRALHDIVVQAIEGTAVLY